MTTRPVLVMGDAILDWVIRVAAYPPRAGNAWSAAPEPQGGGTGANVAVGLARLGLPVALLSKVGDDSHGHFLRDDLAREGVDTTYLRLDPTTDTAVVIAVVDGDGERTFFACGLGGAQSRLRPEEINPTVLAQAAWLHTSGVCLIEGTSPETLLRAMAQAREFKVPVSLDVNLRLQGDLFPETLQGTLQQAVALANVVLASAEEVALLAPAASVQASAQILAGESRAVITRLGPAGAMAISTTGKVTVPAFTTQVVDTLGAGDAFDAGFIAARVQGLDLETALQWGNAVAALKIAQPGARSLPNLAEVESLLQR